jgi:Fe2+ transport system protein B
VLQIFGEKREEEKVGEKIKLSVLGCRVFSAFYLLYVMCFATTNTCKTPLLQHDCEGFPLNI